MSQTAHRPLEPSKDAHEAWSKASCAVLEDLKHENVLAYVSDYFLWPLFGIEVLIPGLKKKREMIVT